MKTIVLVGGGHTHLSLLKRLKTNPVPDTKWILISADNYHYYSGMFSGFIEGLYTIDEIRIDLKQAAVKANCTFIKGSLENIDPVNRTIHTENGSFSYDVLSINIGSHTSNPTIKGLKEAQAPLKPAHEFPDFINTLRHSPHVAVIGGGAAACEMILSLKAWKNKHHRRYDKLSLIYADELLKGRGSSAGKKVEKLLEEGEIQLYSGERAKSIEGNKIMTANEIIIPFQHVIYLGGAQSPAVLKKSGLPVDEKGFLKVNGMLQCIDFPEIFAAGDCIGLTNAPELEKNGVHAVRQGPVLWHNLTAYLSKKPLIDYKPQKRTLAILSTGRRHGLLLYGNHSLYGRIMWQLKNHIDKNFIHTFQ
ncbi:FAD-dependent oxidoreductase [Jeotgalibacillus proteolyticus]|uniref:Pyridine nucleotide-disulfide oxidoreductase n=1 Tax=Jeotgalibacillus proteolyticus TaxID=2082395 RepID=A0A2S5GCC4_9BACL|nr:FAD-dependent oxidoreductase [Jeotgalibacillus proteolyticus]PPA70564.1 pyridine nucleotide-disulfide oxidoreductase [Jeotgalibacillus proteolyticus]